MSVVSRLPAFLLLGLVLLGAALLIAGYGAPVGVGVMVGVLLGGAVMVAFATLNAGARSGWHSFGTGNSIVARRQPAMAVLERHGRDSMRVAGVDTGALTRVVPLGMAVEAGGARVEFVALELREDGAIVTLVAHTRPPTGQVGHLLEVAVSDDIGTGYVASGQNSGSSAPGASRQEIRFAPAPPGSAQALHLRIERFVDPFPGPAVNLSGPWEFDITL